MSVFVCLVCGNEVELIKNGGGVLVCCSQPMELLKDKTFGVSQQLASIHIPVISLDGGKAKVTISGHPSDASHYISRIQLLNSEGDVIAQENLAAGSEPSASFDVSNLPITEVVALRARAYCTQHGLWESG